MMHQYMLICEPKIRSKISCILLSAGKISQDQFYQKKKKKKKNKFGLNNILFKYIDDMLYTFRK